MKSKRKTSFLEEAVGLLIKHFGVERVRAALPQSHVQANEAGDAKIKSPSDQPDRKAKPNVTSMLEQVRKTDDEKYRLLNTFYTELKEVRMLPESQDIRQFAQDIGLKEITGKSRKDLLPKLMRFLLEQPTELLRINIDKAASVSEQQRMEGFSILTDKLLGDK